MNKIKLTDDRWVGDDEPPFIIAEIGNNHNGDLDIAKKLIDVAADAGADAAVPDRLARAPTACVRRGTSSPPSTRSTMLPAASSRMKVGTTVTAYCVDMT